MYLYSENSKWILKKAKATGFPEEKIFHYYDMKLLIEEIASDFDQDTAMMIKASKSTNFGKVVKHLLTEYKRVE